MVSSSFVNSACPFSIVTVGSSISPQRLTHTVPSEMLVAG